MTTEYERPGRKYRFYFYDSGPGNSQILTTLVASHAMWLETVHIILSTSMASNEPVVAKLSSVLDSNFNTTLFSLSVQAYSNWFWQPSHLLQLLSGDQVMFSMTVSAAGKWGILATGWAVVEP